MDEPIWIFIGVLSAIIGLGIITSLVIRSSGEGSREQLRTAVAMLGAQCDQVCGLAENTALTVKVQFPKDAILIVDSDRICGEMTIGEPQRMCSRCGCTQDYTVVLNTSGAGSFFSSHVFSCRYTRLDTRNTGQKAMVNCSG